MKNIIVLDYKNKTELIFTFLIPTLKELWPDQSYGDEWDFIENICEITSYRITRPLFNHGFIIKEKFNLIEKAGRTDTMVLSIQFVSGLPQLDIDLITQSLRQDQIIDGLLSISYQDQYDNTITL